MKHILKNAILLQPGHDFHDKQSDLLIEDGILKEIASSISDSEAQVYDFKGCHIAPAFCDLYVSICDPGFEYRDDINTITQSALAGGYTAICATADNSPITQTKAQVEYIINKAKNSGVAILPVGAVTENFDGKSPTDMLDMHHAGAVAFSDMPHSINNSGVMLRALQYVQPFDGLIITMPFDATLVGDGQVNEGEISVRMGMYGISNVSEYSALQRDIEILKYTGGKLHIAGISTKESLDLIRNAKAEKLNITCSVFVHHLLLTEEEVSGYDSHYKVFPPLRTEEDRNALISGLTDGTIDCISTQHIPLDIDSKNLEFEYALNGIIGLESALGLLHKQLGKHLSKEKLIELLAVNPRKILGLDYQIKTGKQADFILIDFDKDWTFADTDIRSKSKNTPFTGSELKGIVKAVFSKDKVFLNGK